jgi:predicted Zn-dependent peptidase
MKYLLLGLALAGLQVELRAQGADLDAWLKLVAAAVNPDAEGDQKERMRKGLAALADLKGAGMEPEAAVQKAREQAQLGESADRPSKMILELWNLNTERMNEPATLESLRAGRMPEPPLKRP